MIRVVELVGLAVEVTKGRKLDVVELVEVISVEEGRRWFRGI